MLWAIYRGKPSFNAAIPTGVVSTRPERERFEEFIVVLAGKEDGGEGVFPLVTSI
jgi:hypothetical protein